ncbi:MAG: hypothetical protein NC121_16275 [Blautia sp.]|nr:hypothetical protein [Blautia sp.]
MGRKDAGRGWRIFLYGILFITACTFSVRVYAAEVAAASEPTAYSAEADRAGAGHGIPTAESAHGRFRQEPIGDDRIRALRGFLYFAVFFTMAVVLAFVIVKKRDTRSGRQESNGGQEEPEAFLFEFETIPEENEGESWRRQVREDIDAREREGKNTRTLRFRRVNDLEYDLEVNELDYDMEVEYLDEGMEYIDIEQE